MRCSLSPLPSFLPTPSFLRAESPLIPALGSPQSWVVSKLEPSVLPRRPSVLCTCPKWPKAWGDPGQALGSHQEAQVVSIPPGSSLITKHFTQSSLLHPHGPASVYSSLSQTTATCLLSPVPLPLLSLPPTASSPAEPPGSLLLKAVLWLPTACNIESTLLSWP